MENRFFTVYVFGFLALLYICIALFGIFGLGGEVRLFEIAPLTLPSWILFFGVCLLCLWRQQFFYLLFFFVILAFPAPIDDVFPSIPITNFDDRTEVLFPMITRIDLFLILGILIYLSRQNWKVNTFRLNKGIKILLLLYPMILLFHAWLSKDLWDFNIILAYSFHIRYLLLFIILVHVAPYRKYQKHILYGVVLSLAFLLFEAIINSTLSGSSRLISGSLSLNTFANIAAALGIYLWFIWRNKIIPTWICITGIIISGIIVFGSGTRGAFVTVFGTLLILYMLINQRRILVNSMKVLLGFLLLATTYYYLSKNEVIPERYSYIAISERVELNWDQSTFAEVFDIKSSEITSSIKSRLDLFDASWAMIQSHPISGIGPGRWNRYKNQYSLEGDIPKVLLDTHNDYLALIAQYGWILGALWIFLVFFYPLKKSIAKPMSRDSGQYLYVINFAMGIAAFSNSGFFKHQVAAVLLFSLALVVHYTRIRSVEV